MRELLDLAEKRANDILNTRGYIYGYEILEIWHNVLREDRERFAEELRKGNVEFVDFSEIVG